MYEESQRMPFIVRYPKRFRPETVVDDIVNNVDFAPTLLELADVPVDAMPAQFQGRSFVANMEGKTPADWPQATYYRYWMHMTHHDNPAHYGIRTKDHKLIFFYGLPLDARGAQKQPTDAYFELYELREDPHEMHNIIADPQYAEVRERLKAQLLELKERVGDTDERYPELMEVRAKVW
jgi:arylsulfatase A-like enzyme